MSNEATTGTPDAIQILQAKIEAFNKQWQKHNQNWTNITAIPLNTLTKLTFLEETIKYGEKIIVERGEGEDNKLYYYLYNLPNHSGIRIKEQNSTCYVAEDEIQNFSLNKFVYHVDDNFIEVENQEVYNDYLTIDWDETSRKWIATYVYNKYGVTLSFSTYVYNKYGVTLSFLGETIKYGEKIIVERKSDGKFYYYLYNLPNHFGIRIIKKDAVCYSEEAIEGQLKEDTRFSVGDLIYHDGDGFIITKEPRTSGYYFTINPINKRWIATYKPAFLTEVGSTFNFNFMQRLDSPYTYFSSSIASSHRDHVIDVNKTIFNYCGESYGMEAPFHLYTMKKINKREGATVISSTYEEIYDDQTWYFNSQVESGILKNNLVILHEKPVTAGPFYQLVR